MYLPVRSTVHRQILNRFLFFHDKLSHLQQQIETVRSFETPRPVFAVGTRTFQSTGYIS